jgi:DNA-directed RNA polymerase subunit RPC12/RpoP
VLAMALSPKFLTVEMTWVCPHCGDPVVATGEWFQYTSTFTCKRCHRRVRLVYEEKLALFEKYAGL